MADRHNAKEKGGGGRGFFLFNCCSTVFVISGLLVGSTVSSNQVRIFLGGDPRTRHDVLISKAHQPWDAHAQILDYLEPWHSRLESREWFLFAGGYGETSQASLDWQQGGFPSDSATMLHRVKPRIADPAPSSLSQTEGASCHELTAPPQRFGPLPQEAGSLG